MNSTASHQELAQDIRNWRELVCGTVKADAPGNPKRLPFSSRRQNYKVLLYVRKLRYLFVGFRGDMEARGGGSSGDTGGNRGEGRDR